MVLIDRYGRRATDLRISITNRCNFKCIFCHREGVLSGSSDELRASDWKFFVEVAAELGITSYKITGGEPFVRDDVLEISKHIVDLGCKLSIVTNGSLVGGRADQLARIGVDHVNVSLHSLKPRVFRELTGGDLSTVLVNIDKLLESGVDVKLNYVVVRQNLEEFESVVEYAASRGVSLNVIELIPVGIGYDKWSELHAPLERVVEYLERACASKYVKEFQSRPTYKLPSGIEVTVIKGLCNPELCASCTRLRATPSGYLKTCLYVVEYYVDSRKYILSRDREGLVRSFVEAVNRREPFFKRGHS